MRKNLIYMRIYDSHIQMKLYFFNLFTEFKEFLILFLKFSLFLKIAEALGMLYINISYTS